jgi:hypothetical protein
MAAPHGWKRDVMVPETLHYNFSDYPILFETLSVTPGNKVGGVSDPYGDVEGDRCVAVGAGGAVSRGHVRVLGRCERGSEKDAS